MLQSIFTPFRLTWYPRIILLSIALSFLFVALTGKDASTWSGRIGGDYPAFYAAGRIIAEGDWQNLYDVTRQERAQEGLFPGKKSGFLPFAYPPFVALMYYPLSLFNYRLSYIIHTGIMLASLMLALQFLRPFNHKIDQNYFLALALLLSFYPLFEAVFLGQNSALIFLMIVSTWRLALADREWLAGLILGLLLFKPQFALPLICLCWLSGRWRISLSSIFTGAVLFLISSLVSGAHWFTSWLNFSWWFSHTDSGVNYVNSVSWLGFFEAILGPGNSMAQVIGWVMILLTALYLALLWGLGGQRWDLTRQLSISLPALVLLPPHAMYYDMGLVVFSYSMLAARNTKYLTLITLIYFLGFSQVFAKTIGFSPLFFLLCFTAVFMAYSLGRSIDDS